MSENLILILISVAGGLPIVSVAIWHVWALYFRRAPGPLRAGEEPVSRAFSQLRIEGRPFGKLMAHDRIHGKGKAVQTIVSKGTPCRENATVRSRS
jgi:hypothetical protein